MIPRHLLWGGDVDLDPGSLLFVSIFFSIDGSGRVSQGSGSFGGIFWWTGFGYGNLCLELDHVIFSLVDPDIFL